MSSTEQRVAPVLPSPRAGALDDRPTPSVVDPERVRRTPRPSCVYWDVRTASWCTYRRPDAG